MDAETAITIRPTTRSDAPHVATLVDIAGHGIEIEGWTAAAVSDGSIFAAARRLIITDHTLPFHLARAFLIEVDGEVAGGIVGHVLPFQTQAISDSRAYMAPLLELESRLPGYWSVVAVAVYEDFRGRGLATRLLAHAEQLARQCGATGLCIVVEDDNARAANIYRNFGFADHERRSWIAYGSRAGTRNWLLLTKRF